jgi:hypothetical protein
MKPWGFMCMADGEVKYLKSPQATWGIPVKVLKLFLARNRLKRGTPRWFLSVKLRDFGNAVILNLIGRNLMDKDWGLRLQQEEGANSTRI